MTDKETTEVKAHKAEGTMATVSVLELQNNPHRNDEVFVWNEEKIQGLIETYKVDGFQSTFEVTKDKWGRFFLAGGGHHRKEALKRIISGGVDGITPEMIRGVFKDDGDNWSIKVVAKKYSKEQMLRNFMIENADAWGKDSQQNICMMTVQVKDFLDKKLVESADLESFIALVNSPYPLKMDERSYSRAKNSGAGASLVVQYLGENTWSRQAIDFAIKVLYEEGEEGQKLRELAEKLPNVVMAYKFKRLMTQEVDGEKVLSSADDQTKAEKLIEKENLTRADLEAADKIKAEKGIDPLAALESIVADKKEEKKTGTGETASKERPTEALLKPPEQALVSLKEACAHMTVLAQSDDSFSKAQFNEAKKLLKELADTIKKLG